MLAKLPFDESSEVEIDRVEVCDTDLRIALALASEAGSRLAKFLGSPVSSDSRSVGFAEIARLIGARPLELIQPADDRQHMMSSGWILFARLMPGAPGK